MKFYPPNIVRFYYRYTIILVLNVLPLAMSIYAIFSYHEIGDGGMGIIVIGIVLAAIGSVLVHIGLWEKLFGVLIITDHEIQWRCPFRKTRLIYRSDCMEIGAYVEHENSGIPSEQIYISDYRFPKAHMTKQGVMKASDHLIKFWYSEELSSYLLHNFPSEHTSCLAAYIRRKKRK